MSRLIAGQTNTYYEVDSLRASSVSRTLTGDHENRVTDTGGIVMVALKVHETGTHGR